MTSFLLYAAIALAAVACYFVNKIYRSLNYFKHRGISQLPTELFLGNGGDINRNKKPEGLAYIDFYWKFKKMGVKHGGVYVSKYAILPLSVENIRTWVPIDPDLIKTILIKDFPYFSTHDVLQPGLFFNNLFNMDGEEWKEMRRKLTPTFTSGKMKMMFDILLEKTYELSSVVGEFCKAGESAEIKSILARFTTDVIGTCGFGIECSSLKDENSEFYTQGQKLFNTIGGKETTLFEILVGAVFTWYYSGLESSFLKSIEDFFRGVVRDTIALREEHKIVRKDFLHLMIQLKNKGVITELINENEDVYEKTVKKEIMSMEEITGQCVLFFIAGFETSSTTMSFAILELTQNQDVQKKLRKEVREVLDRHNGKMTYEAVQEMTYCEKVVHETLRKYPPVSLLPRLCTQDYTIPGTNSVIEKGTKVGIPIWGIQMDPDYFPEPEKFIPERFSPENKCKIRDMTYLPFGEGPRMCLGLRFGMMQSKAGIAALVKDYNFTLDKRTPYPPEFGTAGLNGVKGGIWVKAVRAE